MKESGARVGKRASRGRDCSLWPRCTSCSSLHKDPEPRVMGLPGKESGQDILPASSPSRSWGSGASHSAEPKENHGAPADVGPACHGAYHGAALEFAFFGRELPTKAASPPPKYHAGPWASEPSLPWDLTPRCQSRSPPHSRLPRLLYHAVASVSLAPSRHLSYRSGRRCWRNRS